MCIFYKFKITGVSSNGEPIINAIIANRDCSGRDRNASCQRRQIFARSSKIFDQLSLFMRYVDSYVVLLCRSTNFDCRADIRVAYYDRCTSGVDTDDCVASG